MEFFEKNKILILRIAGVLMLLIGFVVHFWVTPKEGFTQNEIAAANIARMEAKVAGGSGSSSKKPQKKDTSKFLEEFKDTQAKQMRYLTIIAMILGVGFLGYSFVRKNEPAN
ncbi:hypothetical protein SMGD1_0886 [Sulfurimonas gotlandica GD1]|uniref:Uncharacterized protein n=1 Tax=Sulfurimonas gotlandica (strain DSM 19862 / JCM 16533 / GD1) TaxID=929558 RepID=B6BM13_SULGG|nr:hypothetical protein [Sulfurimonas gotlandica]EDZ61911.1 conserved hypothetical protein [Sulfurimonas gotlandica GD1]EHP29413.1 hypothetical protein SMGD1_0886 [Sulfurimonas gotlandica GD1]